MMNNWGEKMELLQLRYFAALARNGHLGNTAKDLLISPPSLSMTIAKLEDELGVKLFDRVNRRIYLNEKGKLFLEKVEPALALLDSGIDEMKMIAGREEHTIKIAMTSPLLWEEFFDYVREKHRNLHLEAVLADPKMINSGKFETDFFMGNGWDIAENGWETHQILPAEQTLLVVSKKHALAERKTIDLTDLKDETFLVLGKTNPTTQLFVQDMCGLCGYQPKTIEVDYFMRIKMLEQNRGVVLTSELGFNTNFVKNENIVQIPVVKPDRKRYQVIAWKEGKKLTDPQQDFLQDVFVYFKFDE